MCRRDIRSTPIHRSGAPVPAGPDRGHLHQATRIPAVARLSCRAVSRSGSCLEASQDLGADAGSALLNPPYPARPRSPRWRPASAKPSPGWHPRRPPPLRSPRSNPVATEPSRPGAASNFRASKADRRTGPPALTGFPVRNRSSRPGGAGAGFICGGWVGPEPPSRAPSGRRDGFAPRSGGGPRRAPSTPDSSLTSLRDAARHRSARRIYPSSSESLRSRNVRFRLGILRRSGSAECRSGWIAGGQPPDSFRAGLESSSGIG